MNVLFKKFASTVTTVAVVFASFAPLATPLVAQANTSPSLIATSVGNYDQWSLVGTSTKVLAVSTNDGDTSYISESDFGDDQTFTFANAGIPNSATVNSVTVTAVAKRSGSHNSDIKIRVEDGTGFGHVSDDAGHAVGSGYSPITRTMATNPLTGSPWTASQVNAWPVKFGVDLNDSDGARVTQLYVTVDYTPAAVPGCTDPAANNYNSSATVDDGSCTYTNTTNLVIDTINGAPPTGFCIAGPITITGHGITGQQGGSWHLAIGWGDGATSTDSSGITTSGLSGSNSNYTFSASHTPLGPSTGITVILYHSQPSGQDGKVVLINVCAAAPTQGVVVLKKLVVNDNGGTKVPSDFMLHINSNNIVGSSTGAMPGVLLTAGTYTVTEDAVTGYTQTGFSCTVNGNATTTTGNTIKVYAGKNYVCTVTNNDDTPTVGMLKVIKHVVNDNGGTATAGQWTMHVGASTTPASAAGSESGVDFIVTPGSYSVTESGGPSGYSAITTSGCSGTIAAGESKTCTVTNDDVAPLLTLVKQVINGFRSTTPASAWTLYANGATTSISGVTPVSSGPSFYAGTYSLGETNGPTANYTSAIGCVKNGGATTTASTLSLGVGDNATCTFTNTEKQPGTLHVVKVVQNDNPSGFEGAATPGQFTLSITGGNASPSSVVGTDAPGASVTIDAGASYSATETGGPSGYGVSYSTECSGTMAEGGDVTCTVTNNDTPPTQAYLTIVKSVINDNGGTAMPSAWTLLASSTTLTNSVATLVTPGTYVIDETGGPASGYTKTSTMCSTDGGSAVEGTSLEVSAGHSYVCTITNNDIAPSLTLVKNVENNDGLGTSTASMWTLAATGATSTISGAGGATSDGTFQAGTYTLGESNGPSGYTSGSWSCNGDVENVDNTVTLNIGQSATCTITNTAQPGTLHIKKLVIRDNGGTAATSSFQFQVNDNGPINFESDGQNDLQVAAGFYDVTELAAEGYGASYDNCSNIYIPNGGEATCTITNDDGKATLNIVKHTVGADGTFTFSVTGQDTATTTTVGGWATTTIALDAGFYNVVETNIPQGWTLNSGHPSCIYDNQSVGNVITNGESIDVDAGDTVTCTFTNTAVGADLSLTKSVDDNTPDAGQTIVYTLTASNAGPAAASNVKVLDLLPSGVTYVSDDGAGAFATSTGIWTIGSLAAGSSTTLHLTVTVSASAGQSVTNTAIISSNDEVITDYNEGNDAGSTTFTVNTPTPPSGGGGGGGGGGNGPIAGSLPGPSNGGFVLGTSTVAEDCSTYLTAYIKYGANNDAAQVTKLQQFLNNFENNNLTVNGSYDAASLAAVHAFQKKYAADILTPWGASQSTGYVYYTTRKEINTIYCKFTKQFPLSGDQLAEIARIKALGQSFLQGGSVNGGSTSAGGSNTTSPAGGVTIPQQQKDENATIGSQNNSASQTAGAANATTGGSWWGNFLNWLFRK